MHGVGNFDGTTSHFLVIPISNYDVAFAGMAKWEPTILRDLGIFMNVPANFLRSQLYKNTFENEVIANQNIRALRYHEPTTVTLSDDSTTVATSLSTSDASAGTATAQTATPVITPQIPDSNNPFVNITTPYTDNDLMLAYFFLNEKTLIITDSASIIPQILARYAGSQIYQQ